MQSIRPSSFSSLVGVSSPRRIRGQTAYVTGDDPDPTKMRVFFPRFTMFGWIWIWICRPSTKIDQDAHEREETTPSRSSWFLWRRRLLCRLHEESFVPGNFVGSDRLSSVDKIARPRARTVMREDFVANASFASTIPYLSECPNDTKGYKMKTFPLRIFVTSLKTRRRLCTIVVVNQQSVIIKSHRCQNNSDSWTAARALEIVFDTLVSVAA